MCMSVADTIQTLLGQTPLPTAKVIQVSALGDLASLNLQQGSLKPNDKNN